MAAGNLPLAPGSGSGAQSGPDQGQDRVDFCRCVTRESAEASTDGSTAKYMTGPDIRVRARISLLPRGQGRSEPIHGPASYRPINNFFGPGNLTSAIGLIDLPEGVTLCPGESIELEMWFVSWPWSRSELAPGREWLIQEGSHVVGAGTVLEIFE